MPETQPSPRSKKGPNLAMTVRQWHTYVSVLIAPSLLFFAITGALQIFSLHEAHGNYTPAPLIEKLAAVHKDQVFEASHHHPPPKPAPAAAGPPKEEDAPKKSVLALKIYFLLVAVGLVVTTCFGLWMAMNYSRWSKISWLLLACGAALPLLTFLLP